MRWRGGRQSDNVEDRRGVSAGPRLGFPRFGGGGPGFRIPLGRRGFGGFGLIAAVAILLLLGVDPMVLLQGGDPGMVAPLDETAPPPPVDDALAGFVSVVLADTEDTWSVLFGEMGREYRPPKLVLFTDRVPSACGNADAAVGPFYCPADQKVYIDLSFYADLRDRFRAPGDFAQAYVIAHEVGHHVQNLLGIARRVASAQAQASTAGANALSVRLELQADCFAGVWANRADAARAILESGDVDEALAAATAIGDDRLQRQSTGTVTPDSFTHGTSEQRARWFGDGLRSGALTACDTFAANPL